MSNYSITVGETAYEIDIVADQGADTSQTLTFLNSDGSAYSFAGKTVKMQVRPRPGGTLIKDLTSPSGGLSVSTNVVTLATNWDGVAQRMAFYDLWEHVTSGGAEKKLARGAFLIRGSMTA